MDEPLNNPLFDLESRKQLNYGIYLPVSVTYYDTAPQTAGTYSILFSSDRDWDVIAVIEAHGTACSSDGTLQIEKCGPGVAPDSGTALLRTALALNTTANTPQYGALLTNTLRIKRGDRLVAKDAGTLSSVKDLNITILLRRV